MAFSTTQIALVLLGLILVFFGLIIYRSVIKLVGFIVGAGYGIYVAIIFSGSLGWDPLWILIAGVIFVVLLGMIGTYLAQLANMLLFFLAGGLVGVVLGKIVMGMPAQEAVQALDFHSIESLVRPEAGDLLWFLGGGILFVISIDILVILAFTALGAGLIWYALRPLHLMSPDWVIPLVIGILGLMFQEGARRRIASTQPVARKRARLPEEYR
jgi:hypothetical protein